MKGYQKKVIFLKNTGSAIFEEAYFIIRDNEKEGLHSHKTLVNEANRIIEENFGKKKRRKISRLWLFPSFLLGAAVSLVTCIVLFS